jgi:hypothetical protein
VSMSCFPLPHRAASRAEPAPPGLYPMRLRDHRSTAPLADRSHIRPIADSRFVLKLCGADIA